MERLHEIVTGFGRALVETFGIAGLFAVAFLDSSFLSIPEVNDILVVTMSLEDPRRFWVYALVAALGSVTGCLALHGIGRRGGEIVLERRLSPERLARIRRTFRRFDVLAVLVPSLLPPPCPFKIFVLSSGVFRMGLVRFTLAVFAGRTIRYLGEAYLAIRYGRQALELLAAYGYEAALAAVAVLLLVWLVRRLTGRSAALGSTGGAAGDSGRQTA